MTSRHVWRRLSWALAFTVSGCGLLSELDKLKGVTFQLPERSYSVSTSDPQWKMPPATFPIVSCGDAPNALTKDCCTAPPGVPPLDCSRGMLSCEENACALKFTYEQVQKVDLVMEVPTLASFKGQIFSDVFLRQVDLTIDNGMNVTLPPVYLYVAPASVTTASHKDAKRIATLPMKAPGFKGMESIPLDSEAQRTFSGFARDFQTPFNIIISTTVLIKGGTPAPMGKLDLVVSGKVEAKL
jgi:hypothetical protein